MIKIPNKARVYYVCYSRRLTKVTKSMSWTEITMEIDLKKITRNKFLCISLSITVIKWKISAKYMCWFAYSTENAEENMFWSQKKMYPPLKSKGNINLQQQILKRVPFIFLFLTPWAMLRVIICWVHTETVFDSFQKTTCVQTQK
jgi:hypothetical protein